MGDDSGGGDDEDDDYQVLKPRFQANVCHSLLKCSQSTANMQATNSID